MTRKFKAAGVLMAVVAMLGLSASSAQATFTSAGYSAGVAGTSTGDVLHLFGSTAPCTNNTFSGTLSAANTTLTITPGYSSCTAFGLPATVNFTGCDYLFHNAAGAAAVTVDLVCSSGTVDITVYSSSTHATAICHVTVTPFNGKGGLTATNNGSHINVKGEVLGIVAHQNRTNFLCPAGKETNDARYVVQAAGITIAGNNGAVSVS